MERRHELVFEGVHWGDMRRYGKAYCVAALKTQIGGMVRNKGGEFESMKEYSTGYEKRYNDTYGFFPIPQSEIDLSGGALVQNPGWSGTDANFTGLK